MSRLPKSTLVPAVLALLTIVLACVLVVLTLDADRRPAGESASGMLTRAVTDFDGQAGGELTERHREVSEAARREVLAFLDVDHRDMNSRIDAVLEGATGEFAKEYESRRKQLIEAAKKYESVSTGTVESIGVADLDADSATVFVAANSEVESVTTEGSKQPRYYRLQLEMVLEDGTWKTSQVRFVG